MRKRRKKYNEIILGQAEYEAFKRFGAKLDLLIEKLDKILAKENARSLHKKNQ